MIAMDFHMPHNGQTLYGKYYVPGITDGVIILVHGLGEHCGRYEEHVIPALLGANLSDAVQILATRSVRKKVSEPAFFS